MLSRFRFRARSLNTLCLVFYRGLLPSLILTLAAWTLCAQVEGEMRVLERGAPVERDLSGGQAHSYRITLDAGQFLYAVADQRGIDVVVTLFAPDGKKLAEVDSPNGTDGPEPLTWITDAAGTYRFEVRSLEQGAQAGRYRVEISELRAATLKDRKQLVAEKTLAEAEQLREQGTAETLRGSLAKYDESLTLWREVGNKAKEAETLNYMGFVYQQLSEMQKALGYFEKALPIYQALGDRQSEARTLNYIGVMYYYLNQMPLALDYYEKTLALRRAIGDRKGEGVTLHNIGNIYDILGERQKALELYERALILRHEVGDSLGEGETLNSIGITYSALGEKRKAIEFYQQALPLRRATGDRSGEAATLSNIGSAYDSLGERKKALDFYTQAQKLFHEIGDRYGEASALNNLGSLSSKEGEQQRALGLLNQALLLRRAVGDRLGESDTLGNLGEVSGLLHDQTKALDFYNQALTLTRQISYRSGEAESLYQIAHLESQRQELLKALDHVKAAIHIIESLRTNITNQQLRSSYFASVQNYYFLHIDLLMRLHKQQPNKGYDGIALQVSEQARARALLETLNEAKADIRQGVDPKLLERERALQARLNAKAQEQMSLLGGRHTEEQARVAAVEVEALTAEFQEVETKIRQTSPRYAALTQPVPLSLEEIRAQVLDKDTMLLEYTLGAERSYLWAVTTDSIRSYELPGRDAIETLSRSVYALLTDVKRWRTRGDDGQRILTMEEEKRATSAQDDLTGLSRLLLAPVATQLRNKRLVVVADGALQYIPFGALHEPSSLESGVWSLESKAKTKNTDSRLQTPDSRPPYSTVPLIERHEIISLPSASTLALLRRQVKDRRPAAKTVAVLADPVFEISDERLNQTIKGTETSASSDNPNNRNRELPAGMERSATESGLSQTGLKIPRLPGTRDEAMQILSLVSPARSKQAFDFAANRETAMSAELSQYRYVHFATHGFLNSVHPELSGIVLSMVDEQGNRQDGFLRAHEVFNLKLPAELVVLSACQTGLGKEVKGEGLVGLTRGFMYAGSPRVVVSLWNVSDAATAELMTRFYRGMLKDKLRPAAALRAAQVSLMKEKKWQAPFYWAAFTLQGEWR